MSLVNFAHVCSQLQNASRVRLGLTSIPATKFNVSMMLGLQKQGFLSSVTLGGPAPPLNFAMKTPEQYSEAEQSSEVLQENPWMAYPRVNPKEKARLLQKFKRHANTQDGNSEAEEPLVIDQATIEEFNTEAELDGTPTKAKEPKGKMLNPVATLPQDPNHKIQKDLPPLIRETDIPTNPAQRRLWLGLKYWKSEPVLSNMKLISTPKKRITAKADELRAIALGKTKNQIKGIVNPGECIFIMTDQGCLEIREAIERRRGGMVLCRVS